MVDPLACLGAKREAIALPNKGCGIGSLGRSEVVGSVKNPAIDQRPPEEVNSLVFSVENIGALQIEKRGGPGPITFRKDLVRPFRCGEEWEAGCRSLRAEGCECPVFRW
jgi:hypothetical protein